MIELIDNYYIDVDEYENYSLRKKYFTTDKKTNEPKEYYKDIVVYNGSLRRAIENCYRRLQVDRLKNKDLTLKEAITEIDNLTKIFVKKLNEALPSIKFEIRNEKNKN